MESSMSSGAPESYGVARLMSSPCLKGGATPMWWRFLSWSVIGSRGGVVVAWMCWDVGF
ncbi:hypothetical protein Pan44_48630 [Caulifigura coniformis]|uniref:Uncharacterized protein n=2 Tax=Caulifigura coniformis TaxID=2527983 RepID=A0A517SL08_9PLAN|nr:hypothetical protein Pan44_48630 [Caulifigura coniformis]